MHSSLKDILFVIVLYNLKLEKSTTFNSLKNAIEFTDEVYEVDLYVYDNSLLFNSDLSVNYDNICLKYIHDSNNSGVSVAYNKASEYATTKNKKWMLIFDQDTSIPIDALTKYIEALRKWPDQPLYAPKLYSNGILLSPCNYVFYKGFHLKSIKSGINTVKRKNILNSGALISLTAYRKVDGYDSNVWLYFSDFVFFNRLKQYYKYFVVLDVSYEHELSSDDYKDLNFAKNRFNLYCEGAKAASVSDKSKFASFAYFITVFLRSILLSVRLNDKNFFVIFLNKFIK